MDLLRLASFPFAIGLCGANVPFRLRFELLSQRCRLITLEDLAGILTFLEPMRHESQHMSLLVDGLRQMGKKEATEQLGSLAKLIIECKNRLLKRLECEALLVLSLYHQLLRSLGSPVDIQETVRALDRAKQLCQTYPNTAGLLLPAYHNVSGVLRGTRMSPKTYYTTDLREVLWSWPAHKLGGLTKCTNGHVYSSLTSDDCLECGKEAPVAEASVARYLEPNDFLLAMKAGNTGFDGTAYRK